MIRSLAIRALAALALGALLVPGQSAARDLTVVGWGGSSQAAQRQVYFGPFTAQTRLPISDGAYGKPWIFRPKDLPGWWSNLHVERWLGFELGSATPR